MPSHTIQASQFVCPRPIKLFGWIPLPLICAGVCSLVGFTLRCPKCGLERPYQRSRRIA